MPSDLPRELTPLVELMCGHLAAELDAAECPPALRASVIVFARECMRVAVAQHEHPTPVVNVDRAGASPQVLPHEATLRGGDYHARSTLPTEPPVSYEDPPQTGRTSRGFPRAG